MKPILFYCPLCGAVCDYGQWSHRGYKPDPKQFTLFPEKCPDCYEKGKPGKNLPVKKE